MHTTWPDIPFEPWRESCAALHLFTQMVGKYRLARAPWVNHSWQATFYVTARGLTTSLVPDGAGGIEVTLDLIDHVVVAAGTDGSRAGFPLGPMSVAAFHDRFRELIRSLGGNPEFDGRPNEVPDPIAFSDDRSERLYDAEAVTRFFQAMVSIDRVLKVFRTSFIGKVSPVHLFWGSFDLVVTRFSGRPAPLHPGGVPGLPDNVTQEAYSHEVSSAGFWPGGKGVDVPAFYSYAYPAPPGFADARPRPEGAYYDKNLREFLLPYDVVRRSRTPEAALLAYLESTYNAAADLGGWPRKDLECPLGEPRRPRPLGP
jgi:hypothetical protein